MDLQVRIGFDEKAEEILEKLIDVMGNGIRVAPSKAVEPISDVEMVETHEKEENITADVSEDYELLRKEAKTLGVQLVQANKREAVKELTKKYGYKKISDVTDEKLTEFIKELKEIKEM